MFNQIHQVSDILHQALNGLTVRQRVISNNLANADTPGFKASEVAFESQLQRKINDLQPTASGGSLEGHLTHEKHLPLEGLPADPPLAVFQPQTSMRNDRNSVDLELEMTRMAQASISYSAVSQMLSGRFSGLKYVIQEGGK
ncbi:flagellar basal body rod protein FlgB [bacterium (Candidatus Blackallbacteria) CG17_big_fil_post_rev_8_21_14_2_50_48_46]|uniref:Flagellar basal body rod protein FlgB n=1 Tax=bacterium (Candidatus Blackallbacteria) CG17_big_fil_post_rev_8_21_14_2_50_48_46 TaxID=2014261 RepID=A0A2M7G9H9_9BACT|nr:MAG: flagellar basal body rod protein FlgB [bacterium (Candidatus Blackallbacteria) CG18_big_fil_WC_8_21_14_2_50_49_26]PIW18701.1 MAG: flagellar basal body rod protein FlgB [bacterium (Candidatus Blackallbacteria) CG17_big_fil_post_rev_8_21_14_2_50_48_46]PIW46313.1 MAG: flagellar basal body rod protein FlgB [bacterium (Candidatus Blackallbacteria) CG13_big_fil_rev_8_21_14_2_50_49_14]